MLVYLLSFALAAGLAYPLCYRKPTAVKRALYVFITFAYLFAVMVFRQNIGSDYYHYQTIYIHIARVPLGQLFSVNWHEAFGQSGFEAGYVLFTRACVWLNLSLVQYYAVIALFCLAPAAWVIYRYSPDAPLSVWLYVALFCLCSAMDSIRQNMALAILLPCYPLLLRKDGKSLFSLALITLLAMSFHNTAGIMLPIALLCRIPFNWRTGAAYAAVLTPVFLFSNQMIAWVLRVFLPLLGLGERFGYYQNQTQYLNSMGIAMIGMPLVGFLLLLALRKRAADEAVSRTHLHLALWSVIFWLFAAKHNVIVRFYIYTVAFLPIGLPLAIAGLRGKAGVVMEYAGAVPAGGSAVRIKEYVRLNAVVSGAALLALLYFLYGASIDDNPIRGHVGMYACFPYESWVDWIDRLP